MKTVMAGALTYLMRLFANGIMRKRGQLVFAEIRKRFEGGHPNVVRALREAAEDGVPYAKIANDVLRGTMPETVFDARRLILDKMKIGDISSIEWDEVVSFLCSHLEHLQRQRKIEEIALLFEDIGRYLAPRHLLLIALEGGESFYGFAALRQMGRYGGVSGFAQASQRYAELLRGDYPREAAFGLLELARGWACSLGKNSFAQDVIADASEEYYFSLAGSSDSQCSIAPIGASLFLGEPRIQKRLVELLGHHNPNVQRAAGIGMHRAHLQCDGMLMLLVQKWLAREKATPEDIEALKLLLGVDVGDPTQLVEIPAKWNIHPHPEVRRWGLFVVSQFQQQKAGHLFHQVLLDMLEKESDPVVVDALHWVALEAVQTSLAFLRDVLKAFGRDINNRKLESLLDVLRPDAIASALF